MTQWTDKRLVTLLTDNFAAHEDDADPEVARHLALTASPADRARWPLAAAAAAAAAVVLAASITAYAVQSPAPERQAVAGSVTPTPEPDNHALAAAESRRVLAALPVPPGSAPSTTPPASRLRHLGVYDGAIDASLTQTGWWVVPLAYSDLVAWYDENSPADVSSAFYSAAGPPQPAGDLYWTLPTSSASYSAPTAVVSYARLGPATTAIRADVTLAARDSRTTHTFVPETVRSIDVTESAVSGPTTRPTSATITDPELLTTITTAFNELHGALAGTEPQGCGSPDGTTYAYTVTFHWTDHALTADPGSPLCGIGMGLTLDGTTLRQKLDGGTGFDNAITDAIDNQ